MAYRGKHRRPFDGLSQRLPSGLRKGGVRRRGETMRPAQGRLITRRLVHRQRTQLVGRLVRHGRRPLRPRGETAAGAQRPQGAGGMARFKMQSAAIDSNRQQLGGGGPTRHEGRLPSTDCGAIFLDQRSRNPRGRPEPRHPRLPFCARNDRHARSRLARSGAALRRGFAQLLSVVRPRPGRRSHGPGRIAAPRRAASRA